MTPFNTVEAPDSVGDEPMADNPTRFRSGQEKLAAAQAEAEENHDRMLRMAAELDNLKKRSCPRTG
jgi:molecular chaperone GrpE (heat shock protein)